MEIELKELNEILEAILNHYKNLGQSKFSIEQDYYWNIVQREKFNPYDEPKTFTLGQLTWDLENLKRMLEDEIEPTSLDLIWLGQLLIAIGENN